MERCCPCSNGPFYSNNVFNKQADDSNFNASTRGHSSNGSSPHLPKQVTINTFTQGLPKVRILAIEDSPTQFQRIRAMLEGDAGSSYELRISTSLESGLEELRAKPFDAILLDLTLPDSSGVETCARVSEEFADTPIVVLTGLDDEEMAISSLKRGAEDYLVKSQINSHLLVRAIRYAIERKRGVLALQKAHDELEYRVEQRTAELREMQDVAARRQEELAHVSRLNTLGEMASGLAHELNQPMMAIIGFADHCLYIMRDGDGDTEKCIPVLQDAANEAKRAGEIIKRMRRLVSKRVSQQSLSDMNQTVSETVQILKPGLNVNVELAFDKDLPKIQIDRIQIQQVIINLARNASQAMDNTESDQRRLTLRTGKSQTGKSHTGKSTNTIFVEVSDTGPGLAPEDLERLFDPFFTRKEDGLGLGLSISRSIVESHGGKLTVSQNGQHGLTFRFELPTQNRPA